MKNFTIVIVIFLLFGGCENKTTEDSKIENVKEKLVVMVGNKKKELIFNFKKIKDYPHTRYYKDIQLKSKFKMGGISGELFYYPSRILIDEEGNIYILDNLDCSVSKFDSNGNFISKYGRKGKGPGEFENAFAFDVSLNKKIGVVSPNDNKFTIFNKNEVNEFKCKLMPSRIRFFSESEMITFQFMNPLDFSPISKINFVKNKTTEYENIINKASFKGQSVGMLPFLLGDLLKYRSEKIIFISEILGYVIIYDNNGQIEDAFKLIDKVKVSGLEKRKEKIKGMDFPLVRYPRAEEYLFEDVNVFNDRLYVLSNQKKIDSGEHIVDVYSLVDKKYQFSIFLKGLGDIKATYFSDENLYLIRKNTEVEVYQYSILN